MGEFLALLIFVVVFGIVLGLACYAVYDDTRTRNKIINERILKKIREVKER